MSGAEPEHSAVRGLGQSDWVAKNVLPALVCAISSLFLQSPGTIDVFTWALWLRRLEPLGLTELHSRFHIDCPPGGFSVLACRKQCSREATPSGTTEEATPRTLGLLWRHRHCGRARWS
jgi:hypothetical protein